MSDRDAAAISTLDEEPRGRGGQPFGIVRQKDTKNQIFARCDRTSRVGALVPYGPKGEALSSVERKEPECAEESLTSKPAPDEPPPGVGDPKIG